MNILSLFDGISCGRVALERADIPVTTYYASEIDKYATIISEKNYPDIIRLGDVTKWASWDIDWSSIDLILAGFPCTSFSVAGKQKGFNADTGKLFFEFLKILTYVQSLNPNVKFLLENVMMKKEFSEVITRSVGVQPIMINSSLVSAQNRKRNYWCNWSVGQPDDKGIMLKDIIHESEFVGIKQSPRGKNDGGLHTEKSPTVTSSSFEHNNHVIYAVDRDKSNCITGSIGRTTDREYFYKNQGQIVYCLDPFKIPFDTTLQILDKEVIKGKIGYFRSDSQGQRVYSIHGKSVTLCGESGGAAAKMDPYLFGCITPDRVNKRQNGQRFNEGDKIYTLTAQDKHGVLIDGYIRKLTPIECERLQTLPNNYTVGVSNTQRYKMLGNGWTVDVIVHILRGLKNETKMAKFC